MSKNQKWACSSFQYYNSIRLVVYIITYTLDFKLVSCFITISPDIRLVITPVTIYPPDA